jgi:hypothetical protein
MLSSPRARREAPASEPEQVVGSRQSVKRRWLRTLSGLFTWNPSATSPAEPGTNALLAFPSESADRAGDSAAGPEPKAGVISRRPASPRPSSLIHLRPALLAATVVVVLVLALMGSRRIPLPQFLTRAPEVGNLTINTRPVSAEVLVDGQRRGMSPVTLSLAPGAHTIAVRSGNDERVIPLTIVAGADVTHYFEMKAGEPTAALGQMSITTDPAGARVTVDGQPRGLSPITLTNLTAEDHTVTVANDVGSVERKVRVTAGGDTSVMFSLAKPSGPVGGWLSISSPFAVDVVENEDVIGASGSSRFMLAAGRHDVVLSNASLGFRETRRIDIAPGKTMAIRIEPPKASISVNARPWADISIDGTSVGQTPIANLAVSIGPHELVFRHPQLGERRQTIAVTTRGPNRIALDLTK